MSSDNDVELFTYHTDIWYWYVDIFAFSSYAISLATFFSIRIPAISQVSIDFAVNLNKRISLVVTNGMTYVDK